ncbi:dITP/XTP pyrophosphatase [subsurface metagenome]|nr:XTP/dITP diphosphatase [Bacillota bacterium]
MLEIVLATRNRDKVREIKKILNGINARLLSLDDFPGCPEVVEDGETLEANAKKKALVVSQYTKKLSLAEDTGLEVEALSGVPGIHSARFAGDNCTYEDNNRKLLKLMEKLSWGERRARFRCVAALARPEGGVVTCEGVCEGMIAFEMKGKSGFGYDPLFLLPEYGKTFAELGEEMKNKISHRARALGKMKEIINNL